MAASPFQCFTLCFLFSVIFVASSPIVQAQADETGLKIMTKAIEWPMSMSMYSDLEEDDGFADFDDEAEDNESDRRSLFWRRFHYYISYGALSANRIPCPPRSGRSYYTHNCFNARHPVNPYTRGCSRITRCRR